MLMDLWRVLDEPVAVPLPEDDVLTLTELENVGGGVAMVNM